VSSSVAGMSAVDDVVAKVQRWAANVVVENPLVTNVERDPTCHRWFVRARGEEKLVTTVWVTVREETIAFETYFMPAPEENIAATFEYLLRAHQRFYAYRFSIGGEDAVYLTAQLPFTAFADGHDDDELDRMLGAAYAYSEECFRTAMRIGFATKFLA
jgi:Putative bacterial sensory transduction regulator